MVLEANLFKITYFELKLIGSVENKYAAWLSDPSVGANLFFRSPRIIVNTSKGRGGTLLRNIDLDASARERRAQ